MKARRRLKRIAIPKSPAGTGVRDWRRRTRVAALKALARRLHNITWSPPLLQLLLDELYIGDEFVTLMGRPQDLHVRQYPQAVALALALRHSWRPDDLQRTARRLLGPTIQRHQHAK